MRVAITAALCGLLTMAIPVIWGQDQSADQVKHLSVFPVNGNRPVSLSALNIQRGVEYPASVELKGDVETAQRFMSRAKLPIVTTSLGGVETLVTRPARTSHSGMKPEDRRALGISDKLIRLSVGIEATEDLIADFQQALEN